MGDIPYCDRGNADFLFHQVCRRVCHPPRVCGPAPVPLYCVRRRTPNSRSLTLNTSQFFSVVFLSQRGVIGLVQVSQTDSLSALAVRYNCSVSVGPLNFPSLYIFHFS
jgi:hypothetical protein